MTRTQCPKMVLGFVLLMLLIVSRSEATIVIGNQLVKLMQEFEKAQVDFDSANSVNAATYLGYIAGVYDATEDLYSAPAGITTARLGEIVAAYLKRHAERWDESAAKLVIDALTAAFPITPDPSMSKGGISTPEQFASEARQPIVRR